MKTKQKHTLGPWVVDSSKQHAIGGERIFKVVTLGKHTGLIADVSAWWVATRQAETNARLIAAAPDLLTACERCIKALIANGAPNCEAAKEAHRAITKATD